MCEKFSTMTNLSIKAHLGVERRINENIERDLKNNVEECKANITMMINLSKERLNNKML